MTLCCRWLLLILVCLGPLTATAGAQLEAPRPGTLLVAGEGLADPRFRQSVVLVTRQDGRSTAGLVLTRPLGPLPPAVRENLPVAGHNIYWGGPVAALTVTGLASSACAGSREISPGVHLLPSGSLSELLYDAERACPSLRLFLGYAGWAAAQLSRELARGDWQVLHATPARIFNTPPELLWEQLAAPVPAPWI